MSPIFINDSIMPFGNGGYINPTNWTKNNRESRMIPHPDALDSQTFGPENTQRFPKSVTPNTGFFEYNGCDTTINGWNQNLKHDLCRKSLSGNGGIKPVNFRKRKAETLDTQPEDMSRHAPRSRQTPRKQQEKVSNITAIMAPIRKADRSDKRTLPGIREVLGAFLDNLQGHQISTSRPPPVAAAFFDDDVGVSSPGDRWESSTQGFSSDTVYGVRSHENVNSNRLKSVSLGLCAPSREPVWDRNGHSTSQATQIFVSCSGNPGILPSHKIDPLRMTPVQSPSSPTRVPASIPTSAAHQPLQAQEFAGEITQDPSDHLTDQVRQASDANLLRSYTTNTRLYESINCHMSTEQLMDIAVAASASIQELRSHPLPPGPPYAKESAPDAPGPPPAAWIAGAETKTEEKTESRLLTSPKRGFAGVWREAKDADK
ncbi:hypothetical protein F5X99DRAFT_414044 [Biscogniauxia marginata]|nr:hypothetical protein F5X99DRAFT_414044 [Biscogniauxia marginata]